MTVLTTGNDVEYFNSKRPINQSTQHLKITQQSEMAFIVYHPSPTSDTSISPSLTGSRLSAMRIRHVPVLSSGVVKWSVSRWTFAPNFSLRRLAVSAALLSARGPCCAHYVRVVLRATAALSAPHCVKCGVGHILLVHLHADPGSITRKANIYTRGRNWAYPDRQVQQCCRCIYDPHI